jgi:hypothetical protein
LIEMVDLVEMVDSGGLVDSVPEWRRRLVRGKESKREGDHSLKQAALGTSHLVDERKLEMSVYRKNGRGKSCWQSVLTRNYVMATTTSGSISLTLFPCSPGGAGGSMSLPLVSNRPRLKGLGPWRWARSAHDRSIHLRGSIHH